MTVLMVGRPSPQDASNAQLVAFSFETLANVVCQPFWLESYLSIPISMDSAPFEMLLAFGRSHDQPTTDPMNPLGNSPMVRPPVAIWFNHMSVDQSIT